MAFLKLLGRIEIRAVVATLIVGALAALAAMILEFATPAQGMFSPYDSAYLAFVYAAMIGVPLAMLYGAPLYALLSYKALASWPAALAIGAAPGIAVWLLAENEQPLGMVLAGYGLAAALITHFSLRRLN